MWNDPLWYDSMWYDLLWYDSLAVEHFSLAQRWVSHNSCVCQISHSRVTWGIHTRHDSFTSALCRSSAAPLERKYTYETCRARSLAAVNARCHRIHMHMNDACYVWMSHVILARRLPCVPVTDRGLEERGYWGRQDLILITLDGLEYFSDFHHLQKD